MLYKWLLMKCNVSLNRTATLKIRLFPCRLTICCRRNRILLWSVFRSSARACDSEHLIAASPVNERIRLSGTLRPSLFSTSLKSGSSSIFIINNSEPQVIDPTGAWRQTRGKQLSGCQKHDYSGNCAEGVSVCRRSSVWSDLSRVSDWRTVRAHIQQVTPALMRVINRRMRNTLFTHSSDTFLNIQ